LTRTYQGRCDRWAQAAALLENLLYVHGGLTDQYDQYSYTSAPPTSELLLLDLSTSFSATSPPWQLLSNTTTTSSSPSLGWHTLSAFNTTSFLLFGGQPGPNSQIVLTSLNNSATLVSAYDRTDPSFFIEPQNWGGEPIRRIRHSASSTGGKVWIVGGEKADGSGNSFFDHYLFNPVLQEFVLLPSGGNAPPDIYGHASLILPDGRLLILGGYCASCGELIPLNTVWSLDTTQATLAWNVIPISNYTIPNPRRDFAAVVLATGEILIHGGGDGELQTTYSDGWILNTTQSPMVWQEAQSLQQLGARKDHLAVQFNGQVLFTFGESIPVGSLLLSDRTQAMDPLHLRLPPWKYTTLLARPWSPLIARHLRVRPQPSFLSLYLLKLVNLGQVGVVQVHPRRYIQRVLPVLVPALVTVT
jgi:hypothetical protein